MQEIPLNDSGSAARLSIISSTIHYIPEKDNAEGFDTSESIGESLFYNLRFADDIDLMEGSEEELQQLTERQEKTAAG